MKLARLPQLDGVRAVAVSCVMAFHFIPWVNQIAALGSIGVRLFFVLSGFLITRILLASRQYQVSAALRSFYIRRALRIFPVFYVVLAIAAALNIGPLRSTIGWHLTYLTNAYLFNRGSWHGSISHLWSLAVEEQFYLVWPWLMLLLPLRWLRPMIVAMIFIAPMSRMVIGGSMSGVLPTSCLDSLGAGALLAVTGRPLFHAAIGPLLIIAGLWFHSDIALDFGVSLTAANIVARATRGIDDVFGRVLTAKPVMYLGTISYGVYLFHGFMPYVLGRYVPGYIDIAWPLRLVILTAATIVVASLSWRFIEAPILRMKDRLANSQKAMHHVRIDAA